MSLPSRVETSSDVGLSHTLAFIQKLASERYFGTVQLSFQAGHVVNVRQEQSLKPADISNLVANSKGATNDKRNV